MHTQPYTLSDLADKTGIEPRTIRSYIEQDLLPGALSKGRGASYGDEHLHRLGVINRLRSFKSDISLKQLRVLLTQLSPAQIEGIAEGTLTIGGLVDTDEPAASASASALDYLRTASPDSIHSSRRGDLHGLRSGLRGRPNPTSMTAIEQLLHALAELAATQSVQQKVRDEVWHRLAITPDIELSVRGPFDAEHLDQLRQIGNHLRHFLTKGVHS